MFSFFFNMFLLFMSALSLSWFLTKVSISLMTKLEIVDKPSDRRVHSRVIPRGGGIVFVIIYCLLLPLYELYEANRIVYSYDILQVFLPITIVSFWDDVFGVNIFFRLLTHIIASILAIMWLVHPYNILHEDLPIFIDLTIGVIALVTFLNVYNFMDGIDGITGMETIHVSLSLIILSFIKIDEVHSVSFILTSCFIILGWSIGFLYFNWHPAKIFIGDVGSIGIGFILGICLLIVGSSSDHLFLACVIISLYYIGDGGLTLLMRIARREKIWQPHLKHFFHQAVKAGMRHDKIVFRIGRCNFFLMILAINSLYYPILSSILALLSVAYTLARFSRK